MITAEIGAIERIFGLKFLADYASMRTLSAWVLAARAKVS